MAVFCAKLMLFLLMLKYDHLFFLARSFKCSLYIPLETKQISILSGLYFSKRPNTLSQSSVLYPAKTINNVF